MRRQVFRAIEGVGLPAAWRTLGSGGATILTYHGFTDRAAFDGVADHQRMRMPVDAFRAHLEHLVAHYHVISLSELVSSFRDGKPLPRRSVVITFDDGYRSCYELAHPLLTRFGVPATLFVATDFVYEKCALWHDRVEFALDASRESAIEVPMDGRNTRFEIATNADKLGTLKALYRYLKRVDQDERDVVLDEIEKRAGARLDIRTKGPDHYAPVEVGELREMVDKGLLAVGSHTKGHAVLSKCSSERLHTEVVASKKAIEESTGHPCNLFCYPNGTEDDFDSTTRRTLLDAGFVCALTTVPGKNGSGADPMELRRIGAPRDSAEFSAAVSGVRHGLARVYRSASRAFRRTSAGAA